MTKTYEFVGEVLEKDFHKYFYETGFASRLVQNKAVALYKRLQKFNEEKQKSFVELPVVLEKYTEEEKKKVESYVKKFVKDFKKKEGVEPSEELVSEVRKNQEFFTKLKIGKELLLEKVPKDASDEDKKNISERNRPIREKYGLSFDKIGFINSFSRKINEIKKAGENGKGKWGRINKKGERVDFTFLNNLHPQYINNLVSVTVKNTLERISQMGGEIRFKRMSDNTNFSRRNSGKALDNIFDVSRDESNNIKNIYLRIPICASRTEDCKANGGFHATVKVSPARYKEIDEILSYNINSVTVGIVEEKSTKDKLVVKVGVVLSDPNEIKYQDFKPDTGVDYDWKRILGLDFNINSLSLISLSDGLEWTNKIEKKLEKLTVEIADLKSKMDLLYNPRNGLNVKTNQYKKYFKAFKRKTLEKKNIADDFRKKTTFDCVSHAKRKFDRGEIDFVALEDLDVSSMISTEKDDELYESYKKKSSSIGLGKLIADVKNKLKEFGVPFVQINKYDRTTYSSPFVEGGTVEDAGKREDGRRLLKCVTTGKVYLRDVFSAKNIAKFSAKRAKEGTLTIKEKKSFGKMIKKSKNS